MMKKRERGDEKWIRIPLEMGNYTNYEWNLCFYHSLIESEYSWTTFQKIHKNIPTPTLVSSSRRFARFAHLNYHLYIVVYSTKTQKLADFALLSSPFSLAIYHIISTFDDLLQFFFLGSNYRLNELASQQ